MRDVLVLLEIADHRDMEDPLVLMEDKVTKDLLVDLAAQVDQELLDQADLKVHKDLRDMEVHLDRLEVLVPQDHKDTKVLRESRER